MQLFAYQKTNRYFGQIAEGLEDLGAEELAELGADDISTTHRGVYFGADKETLYRVNFRTRLFSRILAPLLRFDCHSSKYLYKTVRNMPWPELFGLDQTFAVMANVAHSHITHSQYAALCVKDAVVDTFRARFGRRPDVNTDDPDLWLNVHVQNNRATISLDTSGGSLHRRGYRTDTGTAPMQETVAAAIIRMTGWNGTQPIIDPMCGSGTLVGEALLQYCSIPAGMLRPRFGFAVLPDFDSDLWDSVRTREENAIRSLPDDFIRASDMSKQEVQRAKKNIRQLPHGTEVSFAIKRFQDLDEIRNSVIVSNPPYGMRLGDPIAAAALMKEIGDFLKQRCTGSTAFLYFGNRELIKHVGLRPSWKKPLRNGGLDGRLVKYELY